MLVKVDFILHLITLLCDINRMKERRDTFSSEILFILASRFFCTETLIKFSLKLTSFSFHEHTLLSAWTKAMCFHINLISRKLMCHCIFSIQIFLL